VYFSDIQISAEGSSWGRTGNPQKEGCGIIKKEINLL